MLGKHTDCVVPGYLQPGVHCCLCAGTLGCSTLQCMAFMRLLHRLGLQASRAACIMPCCVLLYCLMSCCAVPSGVQAHRLKNDSTLTNRALDSLPCKRRVLLSGTPMQNHLDEVSSEEDGEGARVTEAARG